MLWLLTLLDLYTFFVVGATQWDFFTTAIPGLLAAGYMMVKGFAFWGNIPSIIDLIIGAYIVLMMLGVKFFLTWIALLWLANKIIVAFIA